MGLSVITYNSAVEVLCMYMQKLYVFTYTHNLKQCLIAFVHLAFSCSAKTTKISHEHV